MITECTTNLEFEKDIDGRWYAVIPNWDGNRDDLEMVMGADTMLDILAQGDDRLVVFMSNQPFENPAMTLTFHKEEYDGAWYHLNGNIVENLKEIWLCSVTKFVFGSYPQTLYLR